MRLYTRTCHKCKEHFKTEGKSYGRRVCQSCSETQGRKPQKDLELSIKLKLFRD